MASDFAINDLIMKLVKTGASDIHLKFDSPIVIRLHGELVHTKGSKLDDATLDTIATALLDPRQRAKLETSTELDTSYSIPGVAHFRVNMFRQRGHLSIVLRHIPAKIPTIDDLRAPAVAKTLCLEPRGLILVTGVTGSGKSSTLAAMVHHVNMNRHSHIVTIEDPIEFVHQDINSIINQREVGIDTGSFALALRASLRQDPDVILIGEMRDQETIETALRAAETGHLVMSTLHTSDTRETINRIIDTFPPDAQKQIRLQFAYNFKAIISQRLISKKDGTGRVLAAEVLVSTSTIRECILDPDKFGSILDYQRMGFSEYGMQTFDMVLMSLYKGGDITLEDAIENATSPADFERELQFGR